MADKISNTRGLKAAQAPLSKGNQKLVNQVKGLTGYIAMDRRPTPPSIDKILKTNKNFGPFKSPEQIKEGMKPVYTEAKKIAMSETRSNSAPKKISPAQEALNKRMSASKTLNTSGKTMGQIAKTVETKTSGLQGKSGHLGGQHMGGHGTSIGGAEGTLGAGGGMNWETK